MISVSFFLSMITIKEEEKETSSSTKKLFSSFSSFSDEKRMTSAHGANGPLFVVL